MYYQKIIALLMVLILSVTTLMLTPVHAETGQTYFENPGSFGWTETMKVTLHIGENLQKAKPNAIGIGLKKLQDTYSRGALIFSSINGSEPYHNYNMQGTLSETILGAIQYVDEMGENIYYGYHFPYNGEETIELIFNASDYVTDYVDYAVYAGFYTVEEITQDEYNEGPQQSNEQRSAGDKYLKTIEHDVFGTSIQIAPVDLSYQMPTGYEKMEVKVSNDENPYDNYFDLSLRTIGNRLNPLEAHLNQQIGYQEYSFKHDIYNDYKSKAENEKQDYLEMIAQMDFSQKSSPNYEKQLLIPMDTSELERFGAIEGYRSIGKIHGNEAREDFYYDETNSTYVKVNHTADWLEYNESLLYIMPNGLIHGFSYERYVQFPDAYFTYDQILSQAAFDFDHFMSTLAFVPRNNGMTPKEYGEMMKGPDNLSISLISNELTVLNTGVYNTGTKSDSAFNPAVKINKPYDYNEPLILVAEILSQDLNSPIAFMEGAETQIVKKNVDSDLIAFNMITKGAKGGEDNGKIYHPIQKVRFSLRNPREELVARPITLTVKLADASPQIELVEGPKTAAQSGSERSFSIKVTDPDNDDVSIRVTSVFGKVRFSNKEFSKLFETAINTDETVTIGFQAPEIGNFNLNKEMQELSMVALQEGTFNTLMADLEGHYLGQFTEKMKSNYNFNNTIYRATRNWDDYDEKMEAINSIKAAKDSYDKWNKVNDAYGHFGNSMNVLNTGLGAEQLGKDIYEATNLENKGIYESSVDAGIAGISILQTGVGLFGTAVSYIPGGKVLSSKFTLWFNLSTNVWKANLQYLSKMEKIDRAEEVTELIPVVIVATDATGLSTRFVVLIPVIGMEV